MDIPNDYIQITSSTRPVLAQIIGLIRDLSSRRMDGAAMNPTFGLLTQMVELLRHQDETLRLMIPRASASTPSAQRSPYPVRVAAPAQSTVQMNATESVPVTQTPTRSFEECVETVQFSDVEEPPNDRCPITHDQFESGSQVARVRACGHVFTPSALRRWLSTRVTCPVCRINVFTGQRGSQNDEPAPMPDLLRRLFDDSEGLMVRYSVRGTSG